MIIVEQLTLFEKLGTLVNIIFSSSFFVILLFGVILLLVILYIFRKKIVKDKSIYLKIYIIFFILLFIKYGSSILKLCDNLVENIFSDIYFPSLSTYIIMLLITNIFLIITVVSKKITKGIKILNTINFVSIEFLAILILDTIIKENVNIYDKLSVFTNTRLLVLTELSMGLFALWLFILFVIKCIKLLTKKYEQEDKELETAKEKDDNIEVLDFDIDLDPDPEMFKTMVNIPIIDNKTKSSNNSNKVGNNWLDFDALNSQFEYNEKNDIKEEIEVLDFDLEKTMKLKDVLKADDYKYIKAILKYAKENDDLDKIEKKLNDNK